MHVSLAAIAARGDKLEGKEVRERKGEGENGGEGKKGRGRKWRRGKGGEGEMKGLHPYPSFSLSSHCVYLRCCFGRFQKQRVQPSEAERILPLLLDLIWEAAEKGIGKERDNKLPTQNKGAS